MYSNFKEQAMEYVKQAIQEDSAGNYAKAFPLYMNALEYFKAHLKYEKDPKIKEAITQKFPEYLRRAEEIHAVLYDSGPGPASKGDVVEVKVKEEQEAGPGSGPTSAEQIRAESSSGAICESPNTYRIFKEQAIEYVKQAVQEDNAGNYAKAFPLYMNALEYFKTHLKYEKNPKIKEAITQKFSEYLRRAGEIRSVLDDYFGPGPATKGDVVEEEQEAGPGPTSAEQIRAELESWAIVKEKPKVKWSDVAGLDTAKQALQEAFILPLKFPHFFIGKRQPRSWRSFLLYGPPGCGMSYLAKAVANEVDSSTFFSVSSLDLVSKPMDEREKLVSNLFQMARESAPSIIFIDKIDSLCGQHEGGNESEASRHFKTELLAQMQGVGHNDQKVLILAATNTPYALDEAIRQCFDKRIYIPLPYDQARKHMFRVHLDGTPHNLEESDIESLAFWTEGFSGSDISVCFKGAMLEPVRKTRDATFFVKNSSDIWVPCGPEQPGAVQITMLELAAQGHASKILPPPISNEDFMTVLARQRPAVSKSDLDVHERFTKEFGEEG
ncbi:protein SUPPRESSOR OF K(+) TRANSPORT GROWTH DEFECT 1-like [Quercus lobata]|uniref:protein SUPPRESSOR OF K(+) TRANSPORT GROWTH DEFECT 1-like n=1 Tax=Quercus lobata TaxID=97700 RepID=UPI001244BC53|nr:protein SUPPRESSOR OF K(+) TRANSPORT GROWTH DEFECT 1-like [Quercus lobata]